MDQDNLRQRQKDQPTVDGPFSASEITAEMTPKEAYFEQLRTWVNQANMSQNALACFPYYLMANYPQLFQSQGSSAAGSATQMNGGLPGAGQNNVPNELRGERRLADYFENLRQEESKLLALHISLDYPLIFA